MSAPWKCEGQRATLTLGDWNAQIDLARPWAGIHDLRLRDQVAGCRLFQIEPQPDAQPVDIIDSYTRGEDLVVTYAETDARPVRLQVYWRAFTEELSAEVIVGIDLIISTQTSLLYSDPTLNVVSGFPGDSTTQLLDDATVVLHRPDGLDGSIAQCAHPTDCEQAGLLNRHSGVDATYRLFHPGLEKGVIRRGRLRVVLLPRAGDEQLARAAYEALAVAAPPLTT